MAGLKPLEGAITAIGGETLGGWVDPAGRPEPLVLLLTVDGAERTRTVLGAPVASASGDHSRRAFRFHLPADAPLQAGDRVVISEAASGAVLRGCPLVFDGPAAKAIEKRAATEPTPEEIEEMRALIAALPRPGQRTQWTVFGSALKAFVLRELRDRFGRSRSAFIWAILQPMIFMVGLTAIRHALGRGREDIYGVSGMYFFWLGVVPFFMFLHGFNRCLGATRSYRGLYQFRQVQPFDVLLVRVLFEFLTMIVVFALLLSGFVWFGQDISADNWLLFGATVATMFVFTLGMGLLADVCVVKLPESRQVIGVLERPLFLISGVFFTIDQVPPGVREWLLWNPLLHGVDLARGAMLHKYDPLGSWMYLLGSALVAMLLGLAAYRRYRRDLIGQ
ncbi:ABC transporter permease [Panacagrimonas sp.]|uniref:ABC transporter permease n=1 Tax=Panacagrimonas sp. TaxID=2480088 RepID=UPI003B52F2FE